MIRPHALPAQSNTPSNTTLLRPEPKNVSSGVMHSYLVDINSGADETTRAAVKLLEVASDDRIERMSFPF